MISTQQADTMRQWLQQGADSFGECDICHHAAALWDDIESYGAGDFAYCQACWEKLIAKAERSGA